jgi:HEAT repeats
MLPCVALFSCAAERATVEASQPAAASLSVPGFVDDATITSNCVNCPPFEVPQFYIHVNNSAALGTISKLDPEVVRREMTRRVSDTSYPLHLRNLAAGVLMIGNDAAGRDYFRNQFERTDARIADVFWVFGNDGLYGAWISEPPRMDWAEDMMLSAIQNRTKVSRDDVWHVNFVEGQKQVEIRELAVSIGNCAEILAKIKSRKALPIMVKAVNEQVPYNAKLIGVLGQFDDPSVEPLVLKYLGSTDPELQAAVRAAVDLKLKAAVPILLKRLATDTPDEAQGSIRYGLNELADSNALPALREALPSLKGETRDGVQLLILKLQGGDPVPELLAFLRDPNFANRYEVIDRLEALKDNRAVHDLTVVLCTDTGWAMRRSAAQALGGIASPDAIAGLVQGLDADYRNVPPEKVSADYDYKPEFQKDILEQLKRVTGQDFGTDSTKWKNWLAAQDGKK